MTNEEKNKKLMEAAANHLAEYLEQKGPVTALFTPYWVRFQIFGTENEGMMKLTYKAPGELRLQIGAYRKGTDRIYSHFLSGAPGEEIICDLRDAETRQLWLKQIQDLSNSVDDFWD